MAVSFGILVIQPVCCGRVAWRLPVAWAFLALATKFSAGCHIPDMQKPRADEEIVIAPYDGKTAG